MEADGHRVLKLNTGNPAVFGFEAPDVIMRDMIAALPTAQGYSTSKGIISARRAIFPAMRSSPASLPSMWKISTWVMVFPSSSP